MVQFVASIGGRKLPGDRAVLAIALQFHLIDTNTQVPPIDLFIS